MPARTSAVGRVPWNLSGKFGPLDQPDVPPVDVGRIAANLSRNFGPPRPDQVLAAVATAQRGLVTLHQLAAMGIGEGAVANRVSGGRLHRVFPAVFSVGHSYVTPEARCLAAVLACGDGSFLSHRAGAWRWRILEPLPWRIDVIVPRTGRTGCRGIAVHRPRCVPESEVTILDGIRVATVARVLLDLGDVMSTRAQLGCVREAEVKGVLDRAELQAVLERAPRRRGSRALKLFLGTTREADVRSRIERPFLDLCHRAGLPEPEANMPLTVAGRWLRPDFLWRDLKVIVETDGAGTHYTISAFESDRRRDADLLAAGYVVLRFTRRRLKEDRAGVVETVRNVLRSRGWAG
jgi:hypothetical protein